MERGLSACVEVDRAGMGADWACVLWLWCGIWAVWWCCVVVQDNFTLLIAVVLSAQTTDGKVNQVRGLVRHWSMDIHKLPHSFSLSLQVCNVSMSDRAFLPPSWPLSLMPPRFPPLFLH